jgi:hypothetical protein
MRIIAKTREQARPRVIPDKVFGRHKGQKYPNLI